MKSHTILIILICLGLLAAAMNKPERERGPERPPAVEETGDYGLELAAADNYLRSALYDYSSAKLDWDSRLINGTLTVRVNAKNRLGGYVGWRSITFRRGIIQ